jgi:hypothetical protein
MAQHRVNFNVPDRPLAHADIIFSVRQDDDKFGELRISKGGLVWYPRNKVYGYKLTWKQLDRLAQDHGRRG